MQMKIMDRQDEGESQYDSVKTTIRISTETPSRRKHSVHECNGTPQVGTGLLCEIARWKFTITVEVKGEGQNAKEVSAAPLAR